MAKGYKNSGENGKATRFKEGNPGGPGRPRKFVSTMRNMGYNRDEVDLCIRNMMAMTETEVKSVWKDPRATMLEKAFAQVLMKAKSYGDVFRTEAMLTRTFGSPVQRIEEDINVNVKWEDPE